MPTKVGFSRTGLARVNLSRVLAAQSPQVPLAAGTIPQFVESLPGLADLGVIAAGAGQIELHMTEFQAQVLPAAMGLPPTWVWGYLPAGQDSRPTYLGPVIVATRGTPTEIKFVNDLGMAGETNVLAYKYGTDQTLHWADPLHDGENMLNHMAMPPQPGEEGAENYEGPIPAVPHLHGGEVPPVLDGGPDAWYTSDGSHIGSGFYSMDGAGLKNYCIYRYPNTQEGAPIWFHDHTLGATRLNVYCGLAGGYWVTDPPNEPWTLPEVIPLVIQDRAFDTNGQLFFPADTDEVLAALNPEHPYWSPEFIGDVICVNGKAWPKLEVSPKRYMFYVIDGSNARGYEMFLVDPVSKNRGPNLWVIGTDGGYLDKPVPTGQKGAELVMLPGERYLVIVDFSGYQAGVVGPNGTPYSGQWLLRNTAKAPFPGGDTSNGMTTGRIMRFDVVGTPGTDESFNPAIPGITLRGGESQGPAIKRLVNPLTGALGAGVMVHKIRQLTLNEVMGMPQSTTSPVTGETVDYPGGPLEILVNNTKWSGERIVGLDEENPGMYAMEPIPGYSADPAGNYLSELPQEGETEVWELINLTADAHPIHLHLVQFQIMNRQNFDVMKYGADYAAAFPGGGWDPMTQAHYPPKTYIPGFGPPLDYNTGNPAALGGNPDINAKIKNKTRYLSGAPVPPRPQEAGWKDTVIAYPGQVTRIVVRWAPTDLAPNTAPSAASYPFDPKANGQGYVWHCHIVDHEDNEMMRPDEVQPNAGVTRDYVVGEDY